MVNLYIGEYLVSEPRVSLEDFEKIRDIFEKAVVPMGERTAFILDRVNDVIIHIDCPLSEEQARELGWVE